MMNLIHQLALRLRAMQRLARDSIVGTNEDFTDGPMNRAILLLAIFHEILRLYVNSS